MKEVIKLGQLLGSKEQRDAVHVAVIPCEAIYELDPGEHVGLVRASKGDGWIADRGAKHIGVIDPFLTHSVGPKQRFYVILYPNTITSLRHQWTHPAIDGKEQA